jgi:SAM-dependent methyltransferase
MLGLYSMNINWKIKSLVFLFIDFFSAYKFLYFLQKYVTQNSKININSIHDNWIIHSNIIKKINSPVILEFGAGKNLAQNIFLSNLCSKQIVVDLYPMLDIKYFNLASYSISNLLNRKYVKVDTLLNIYEFYNIQYIAPFDIGKSSLPDNSIDVCISTNTLEHIPKNDIINIFSELRRVVKSGGYISAIIDYSDHYSHTDKKISKLNFLSFDDIKWNKYFNHKSHYQNRLRHSDFIDIFDFLGFKIIQSEVIEDSDLPGKICHQFNIDDKSLSATKGYFLLSLIK